MLMPENEDFQRTQDDAPEPIAEPANHDEPETATEDATWI